MDSSCKSLLDALGRAVKPLSWLGALPSKSKYNLLSYNETGCMPTGCGIWPEKYSGMVPHKCKFYDKHPKMAQECTPIFIPLFVK